jgi:uncharacterized protein
MPNQLAGALSPYLLQHAENPVQWQPWGSAAFAEAARRDVPVFVSIGYAACHWCHVMAHESFEDEEVAAYLNARFVSVKVDREEYPDVDEAYMAAAQLLTGQGGWPLSVFATPDGRPFHAGTYYPPAPRLVGGGPAAADTRIPSFAEVLHAVHAAWTGRRDEVLRAAASLTGEVGRQSRRMAAVVLRPDTPATPPDAGLPAGAPPSPDVLAPTPASPVPAADSVHHRLARAVANAVAALGRLEDADHGGFGTRGPKFPPSTALGFLLQSAAGAPPVGSGTPPGADAGAEGAEAWAVASRTLSAMGTSALYDSISGGFARYATDRQWALPHFEKMLYDNAQLLRWTARWAAVPDLVGHVRPLDARHPALARRLALGTADWLAQRMATGSGAFAASLDADTVVAGPEGQVSVEGATYTWTPRELREVLAVGADPGDASEAGTAAVETLAAALAGVPVEPGAETLTLHAGRLLTAGEQRLWDRALPELRRRVAARPQPARDAKEIASWNGLAVTALTEAWALLGEEALLDRALAAGEALWRVHCGAGTGAPQGPVAVLRSALDSRPGPARGTLADHAHVADAFLALYRSTGDRRWKARARAVIEGVVGTLVVDTDHGPALLAATAGDAALAAAQGGPAFASPLDGAEPSAVGVWAEVLAQWHVLSPEHAAGLPGGGAREWSTALIGYVQDLGERAPVETGTALRLAARHAALDDLLVAAGGTAGDRRRALGWAIVHGVVGVAAAEAPKAGAESGAGDPGEDVDDVTAGRTSRGGEPALYLCHGTMCHAPVGGTEALDRLVRSR